MSESCYTACDTKSDNTDLKQLLFSAFPLHLLVSVLCFPVCKLNGTDSVSREGYSVVKMLAIELLHVRGLVAVALVRAAAGPQAVGEICPAGAPEEEAPSCRTLHYQK